MRDRNGTAEKTKYPSLSQTEPINKIRLMSMIEILELSVQKVLAGGSMSYVCFPRGPFETTVDSLP